MPARCNSCSQFLAGVCLYVIAFCLMGLAFPVDGHQGAVLGEPTMERYAVDKIEEGIALLLPQKPHLQPLYVNHKDLTFAKEGDILDVVFVPELTFYPLKEETRRARGEIAQLFKALQQSQAD